MRIKKLLFLALLIYSLVINPLMAGVNIEVIKEGDGKTYPKAGQTVTVHYTGALKNGKKFDSSYDRNQPFSFIIGLGEVIKGWDEGLLKLSKGEKAKLTITSDYAYGENGVSGIIPANSTLIFEVEIIDIKDQS